MFVIDTDFCRVIKGRMAGMIASMGLATRGREYFARYLLEEKYTQKEAAIALGVSQPAVSSWLFGKTRPSPSLRRRIEEMTGIPARSWETDEERTNTVTVSRMRHYTWRTDL